MFLLNLLFAFTLTANADQSQFTILGYKQCAPFEGVLFSKQAIAGAKDTAQAIKQIELFVNNKSHGSFTRGTYKVLNFKSEVKDVDICVKYNDKKECLSIKPILFNTDLYLVKIKKDKIILDRTPKNVRKTLISDIKNGKYVEMNK